MSSELRAALERALAFDEKAAKGREWWLSNYDYYGHALSSDIRYAYSKDKLSQLDEGCSRESAIHVVEKANIARLAPLHAAMLDVIAAAEGAEEYLRSCGYDKSLDKTNDSIPEYQMQAHLKQTLTELRKTLDGVK